MPPDTDIAIIGMAALFPGAKDLQSYWQNILNRVDAVREGSDQWSTPYYDPDSHDNDRLYTRRGGFVEDLADFNPMAFGIMPNSVVGADPDHFLALKLAQDALTDAGYGEREFDRERTGIILGRGTYINRGFTNLLQHGLVVDQTLGLLQQLHPDLPADTLAQIRQQLKASLPPFTAEMAPGMVPNVVTGRIANRLGLMGPNYVIDAACSSSLIAMEMGIQELHNRRCDVMLAGGVHVPSPPQLHMIFAQLGALSHGQIRPFDQGADGTLLSEGCGILVLKRRQDAERDGDRIYALIKATGNSSDGKALGLLAPRFEGEVLALKRAYYRETGETRIDPATVTLVEAHGTGIPLGDKTEVRSLSHIFGDRHDQLPHRALGSVKSMIGHCTIAAGAAGLIKSTLALYHKVLPPTLCDQVNPDLGLEQTSFYINNQTRPWIHSGHEAPRRAAVNAFGFGGVNAHVVLEEYNPAPAQILHCQWPTELVQLSAASGDALLQTIVQVRQWIHQPGATLADLAYSLAQLPSQPHRLGVVATDLSDLDTKLDKSLERLQQKPNQPFQTRSGLFYAIVDSTQPPGKVAFLFPGEGAQYPNMLADLCLYFPQVREWFDFLDATFADRADPPSQFIFPPPTSLTAAEQESVRERLFTMDVASETVFIASLALNHLLQDCGIPCDLMVGHSTGENSALIASETIKLTNREDLGQKMRHLNQLYGQLAQQDQIPKGVLLTVGALPPEQLAAVLAQAVDSVHLAMDNCPNQAVLFGPEAAITGLEPQLQAAGAICQRLPFDRAYHTPLFDPVTHTFASFYEGLTLGAGRIPLYSCATMTAFPEDPEEIRQLASQQWSSRVRFRETIAHLHQQGVRVFIEVGPSSNLTAFVDDILKGQDYLALPSNRQNQPGLAQLQQLLARLWLLGLPITTAPLYQLRSLRALDLAAGPVAVPPSPSLRLNLEMPVMRLSPDFAAKLRTQLAPPIPQPLAPVATLDRSGQLPHPAPPASPPHRPAPETNPNPSRPATPDVDPQPAQTTAVVADHFNLMQGFLSNQSRVAAAVYRETEPLASQQVARDPGQGGWGQSLPLAPWPLLGEVLAQDADSLWTRRCFDLEQDPFLRDHTLGSAPSRYQPAWTPLPVIPFTGSLEILAEAASYLTGGQFVVIGLEAIRGYRWSALDQGQLVLDIHAQRQPQAVAGGNSPVTVQVSLFQVDWPEGSTPPQKVFEGRVVLASQSAAAPPPLPFHLSVVAPSRWADPELYTQGMFHGPLFQGVQHIDRWGPEGIEAEVRSLHQPEQFFQPPVQPIFQIDMVLLDAATQLAAFWIAEQWGTEFHLFPFQLQAVDQYHYPLPSPATLRCRGQIRFIDAANRITTADFDFLNPQGQVVARLTGLQSLYFPVPAAYAECRLYPQQSYFSEPWLQPETGLVCRRISALPADFFTVSGRICERALAHLTLMPQEREFWYSLPETSPRRQDWLLGRIVAKDAVRQWASQNLGIDLAPMDVGIFATDQGQPVIYCPQLESHYALPGISISHRGGTAIAAVSFPGYGIGIDLENRRQTVGTDLIPSAFTPQEQDWLTTLEPDAPLILWCAKEAAAKAAGLGLQGNPREWQISAYLSRENRVTVVYQAYGFDVRFWSVGDELLAICHYPLAPPPG